MEQSEKVSLPLFVYGSLKPEEIAFSQVEEFVENWIPAELEHFSLCVRDGVPFIKPENNWKVQGFLLFAKHQQEERFYQVVEDYEGTRLYVLDKVTVISSQSSSTQHQPRDNALISACTFVGRRVFQGNPEALREPWTSIRDPIFSKAFPQLHSKVRQLVGQGRITSEFDYDWAHYNELAGSYLLLTSFYEHLAYLKYGELFTLKTKRGYEEGITARLKALETSLEFQVAFGQTVRQGGIFSSDVTDSRNLDSGYKTTDKASALRAWYKVRSNLQHRGKSSFRDFDILRAALVSSINTFSFLLRNLIPGIVDSDDYRNLVGDEVIRV
jgi:hypothetical protein